MNFLSPLNQCTISLIIFSLSSHLYAVEAVYHWRARVIPIAFNNSTKQWNILLGHDRQGYWTDFSLPGQPKIRASITAQEALSSQTNGFYKLSLQGVPTVKTSLTDLLHIVKVPYTERALLQTKAKNPSKDDFVWIPLSEFSHDKKVKKPLANGKMSVVPYGIHMLIKKYILKEVNKLKSQPKISSPQSPDSLS